MRIYKTLPDLKRRRQLSLWHKALRAQWSAEDIQWHRPCLVPNNHLRDHMARVLTPILIGEQSAFYSISALIPILGETAEVEGQFYLSTWLVDEARHTELFSRYYHRLEREPLPIRRMPGGYLFQAAVASKEPAEWLAGTLVSEVLAKIVMEEFLRLDLDPALSEISDGILRDEARHLAFNHIYLEERFMSLFRAGEEGAHAAGDHLRARMDKVMSAVPKLFETLDPDLKAMGLDREYLTTALAAEARDRLETSIARGQKMATGDAVGTRVTEAQVLHG